MKLFAKLAISVSLLLMGAIVVLSLSFYWAEERTIRQEAQQEQQGVLTNLVHIAREAAITNDDLLLVKYTRWLLQWHPAMTSASVADTQGAVLAHSEPGQIGHKALAAESLSETKVLSGPIYLGNHWIATASVAFSQKRLEESMHQRIHQLQGRVAWVACWSLMVGLLVSFAVALSWTRPIQQLSAATREIGQGRWNVALGALDTRGDELGDLSRAFTKMAGALQQLDHMKEDFVSAVTHELRSPLGAIESYLNLIAQELHEGISLSAWENYLERLRINTQRLTRFINDLLDVAALDRGKMKLQIQPVDLLAIAQDVLGLLALKMREKALAYDVLGDPPVWVQADPEKIRQVLINLVSNAIKFTPAGGRIQIQLRRDDPGGVCVSVKDTGIGIALEDQSSIFNKFEQIASARRNVTGPKGTGLGLSISKALIELHGQTLNIQSDTGRGSCFYFVLPAAKPAF
jgi:signal transduction histidine kinase